jgi:hypothetical protein
MRVTSTVFMATFGVMLLAVCILAALSRWVPLCGLFLLPLDWPGVFIFGSEWEASFGVWGSRLAAILVSIPSIFVLALPASAFVCHCISMSKPKEPANKPSRGNGGEPLRFTSHDET